MKVCIFLHPVFCAHMTSTMATSTTQKIAAEEDGEMERIKLIACTIDCNETSFKSGAGLAGSGCDLTCYTKPANKHTTEILTMATNPKGNVENRGNIYIARL